MSVTQTLEMKGDKFLTWTLFALAALAIVIALYGKTWQKALAVAWEITP